MCTLPGTLACVPHKLHWFSVVQVHGVGRDFLLFGCKATNGTNEATPAYEDRLPAV